jgi:cytochrome bd ubiquinol oxidase subunit II
MINTLWFLVLTAMLAAYAVLDGFDLGVGVLHLGLARRPDEREAAIDAIGPVWNGNEVWLLAAGGAMVVAFPRLYAAAFSGFYLPLMIVLWLLILRGVAIELRHQVDHELWRQAWDVTFCGSSALLAVIFGVAVGNVLRGVPLDGDGSFIGSFALLLNPFALLCGVLSLSALALHGAAYLAMKTDGPLQQRARRSTLPLVASTAALLVTVAAASFGVQPTFTANFSRWPALTVMPLGALVALATISFSARRGAHRATFLSSAALIVATLGSAAAGLYPRLLPGLAGSALSALDIDNAAASAHGLWTALAVGVFGMSLVAVYQVTMFRTWRGKATKVYHQ